MPKEGEHVKLKNYEKKDKIAIHDLYRFLKYFGPRK